MLGKIGKAIGGALGTVAGTLNFHRAWLTLLAVAALGAAVYVAYSIVAADRDRLAHWASLACASAGQPFPTTADAPRGTHPGDQCAARIAALAKFEGDAARLSATALAEAAGDRETRIGNDTTRARQAAESARDATLKMEQANADLKGDRVTADWFDAFNDAAGLHR